MATHTKINDKCNCYMNLFRIKFITEALHTLTVNLLSSIILEKYLEVILKLELGRPLDPAR